MDKKKHLVFFCMVTMMTIVAGCGVGGVIYNCCPPMDWLEAAFGDICRMGCR
ncbi:MAG: hypothetical protein NTX88_01600 [Candidatus Atribacteria bacterium]|nr:hypothetical protein [Candidatus Atribacteria bacterium]